MNKKRTVDFEAYQNLQHINAAQARIIQAHQDRAGYDFIRGLIIGTGLTTLILCVILFIYITAGK